MREFTLPSDARAFKSSNAMYVTLQGKLLDVLMNGGLVDLKEILRCHGVSHLIDLPVSQYASMYAMAVECLKPSQGET